MMKKQWRYLAAFYVLVYALYYIADYAISGIMGIHNLAIAALEALMIVIVMFLVAFGLIRKSQGTWNWSFIGFRREGTLKSFLWANAIYSPVTVLVLIVVIAGRGDLLIAFLNSHSQPPVALPVPAWYPLLVYAMWLLGGIIAFGLMEAFPYENLLEYPAKYRLLVVWALWSGLYNLPLLAPIGLGEILPSDILMYGFLFLLVYHESRNSVGLILTYVIIDTPIWYVSYLAWGSAAPIIDAVVAGLLGMSSIGILVYQRLHSTKQE